MKKTKAVEMVRRIRDELYELTKDKSNEELKAYFHSEAAAANAEARRLLRKEHIGDRYVT